MVQLQNVSKSHSCLNQKIYLKGLFHRLRALIALNCSLIFVTDGSIPGIKLSTYRRRLNNGSEVVKNDTNSQQISSLKRNKGSEFSLMIKEAKALGLALGIPCLDGLEEGEAQCALLNSELLCDGCFTSDSDVFLFGARTVYRDICLGECPRACEVSVELIALALLLGSDYTQGVYGMGRESARQIVKTVGDSTVLQKIASEGLSFTMKGKNSKKPGLASSGDGQYIHKPLFIFLYRVLIQHSFQRAKLQQFCAEFFAWPPEKTDEYILPKIAEKDLRRFANLRSNTSDLGFNIPLQEVPVSCPVSGIVKHRKVQGNECYEVSWKNLDGLSSSVVPADLLQSACPEMIVEFEEQRAQGRKPNKCRTKTKKSEATVAEIDERFRTLLLEIESESRAVRNLSQAPIVSENSNSATGLDDLQEIILDVEPTIVDHAHGTENVEVINLLSPSPAIQTRKVSKFRQGNCEKIDVIDLSDTENDQSPEHERKARELRLFLASLKGK
ncbi:Flap endonuclease GEN-like 2 [Cucurbita argyrosperma subsp. argyrosperma]|nr:Flap endonuclease GEN-like 2 [Cucurbita argyrosperma subsp. argyrosperma]